MEVIVRWVPEFGTVRVKLRPIWDVHLFPSTESVVPQRVRQSELPTKFAEMAEFLPRGVKLSLLQMF